MKVFKVAYNPGFSDDFINKLKEKYFPSMIDSEGIMGQYPIDDVVELVYDGKTSEEDYKVFKELQREDVDYIEV